MTNIDPRELRNTLGQFATGVTVITTRDKENRPVGVTASSFNSVSLDPPLILWSLDKSSASLPAFTDFGYFAVHVLANGQESLSNNFARRGEDKFANIDTIEGINNLPIIPECAARFQCKLMYSYEGGDHVILVGEVKEYENFARKPLIFHSGRYAQAKPIGDESITIEQVFDHSGGFFGSDFLSYLVSRAHYQLHQPLMADVRNIGLSEIDYFILSAICIKHEMSFDTIVGFLMHTGEVPTIDDCRKMQELGLLEIEGVTNPLIRVTETGKLTYIKLLTSDAERGTQAVADLSNEELSDFIHTLKHVIKKTDPGVPEIWA